MKRILIFLYLLSFSSFAYAQENKCESAQAVLYKELRMNLTFCQEFINSQQSRNLLNVCLFKVNNLTLKVFKLENTKECWEDLNKKVKN